MDIQIGESTHNHDHVIKPINFRAIKTIVSKAVNPIPPLLLLFDKAIFFI
jgi:hypothetical protein